MNTVIDEERFFLRMLPVKLIRAMSQETLGNFARSHLRAERVHALDLELSNMAYQLRTELLAARVLADRQEFAIQYPASWWQHFKRDRLPGWLTRRWPVKFTQARGEVDFSRYDTYPLANVMVPPEDFGYPVRFESWQLVNAATGITACASLPARARYLPRRQAEALLADAAWKSVMKGYGSRIDAGDLIMISRIFMDTLAEHGVNPDQLITEIAEAAPRRPEEATC